MILQGVGHSKMLSLVFLTVFPLVLSSFLQVVMTVPCIPGSGLLAFGIAKKLLCFQNAHKKGCLLDAGTRTLTSRHWAPTFFLRGQFFQLSAMVPCLLKVCAQ